MGFSSPLPQNLNLQVQKELLSRTKFDKTPVSRRKFMLPKSCEDNNLKSLDYLQRKKIVGISEITESLRFV